MDVQVITYDGHRANEKPKAVVWNGERLDVIDIEDRWIVTGVERTSKVIYGFVVRCQGGARFRLEYNKEDNWSAELLPGPRGVRG